MKSRVQIVPLGRLRLGAPGPFFLIAGPCVIESARHSLRMARRLKDVAAAAGVPFIFKASYDKANRSSLKSYRGPGIERGLAILAEVRAACGVPVLTDVHEVSQVEAAAAAVDVLQIPAFLCRQTDLLVEAARSGKVVNIKKGQFLAPWDMRSIVAKTEAVRGRKLLLTERGSTFGYNNLVVDMRGIPILRSLGFPVVFDATHSVQRPGGLGDRSGGDAEFIEPLAGAALAVGADGLFLEVHDRPERALSDGPNSLALRRLPALLARLDRIRRAAWAGAARPPRRA
jgi:2-dehydro-3-deoxyphosphooctonate aldolase (KDO 8-P synthase)